MQKAINFDLDTKKYERITNEKSPKAYLEIKEYFKLNGFIHRQGSGYVSKESITDRNVSAIIMNMSKKFKWLKFCVKEMDTTNVGKQYSMLDTIEFAEDNKNIEM